LSLFRNLPQTLRIEANPFLITTELFLHSLNVNSSQVHLATFFQKFVEHHVDLGVDVSLLVDQRLPILRRINEFLRMNNNTQQAN
jgi:hypothetical protein